MKPTTNERDLLQHARRIHDSMDWAVTSGRVYPLRLIRQCERKGWLRELPDRVVIQDGDGFTIEPERYRRGWELTPEGDALAKETTDGE